MPLSRYAGWHLRIWCELGRERRRHEPLLDLRFFHSVPFSSATVIAVCMFAALGGFLFLSSLYLQEVRGLSAFRAGLCILPPALAVMIVSPLSGRLVAARGARPSLLISGGMLALSALLLTQLQAQTPLGILLPVFALFGIGFGMVNAPITNAAVSGMPRSQAGVAAAVASTSRQLGQSLGVAVVGALAAKGVAAIRGSACAGSWVPCIRGPAAADSLPKESGPRKHAGRGALPRLRWRSGRATRIRPGRT